MDEQMTVAQLKGLVGQFVHERNWERRHTPRNLAVSVAIEAAELMEHFQWLNDAESSSYLQDTEAYREVADELADVLIYALSLANAAGIDLSQAITSKLDRNRLRFPIGTP